MMKFNLATEIRVFILSLFIFLAGCAVGGVSKPVQMDFEQATVKYEKSFTTAIRAMNDVGKITYSDKESGSITGTTNLGVSISVYIERLPSGGVKLNVNGKLPGDRWIIGGGVEQEVEKYISAYKSKL